MKTSLITTEQLGFLDELFPQLNPRLTKIEYIGTVSVFTFFFEQGKDLREHWENITNAIAAYYQSEFEADEQAFERWNIYVFFLVKEPVRTQLKYRIENDKFSCRKIVIDEFAEVFSDEMILQLIDENIINNDLALSPDMPARISTSLCPHNIPNIPLPPSKGELSPTPSKREFGRPCASYSSASNIFRCIDTSGLKVTGKNVVINKDEIAQLYQQIIQTL